MNNVVLGLWCGLPTSELLAPIGEPGGTQIPLLKLTMKRLRPQKTIISERFALVPWTSHYDALALDAKAWGYPVSRSHPDERIAMRDLVAGLDADIGVLVYGNAATIDQAEIRLAIARLRRGVGDQAYGNQRMWCLPASVWLLPSDTEDWVPPMSNHELSLFYANESIEAPARALRARKATR